MVYNLNMKARIVRNPKILVGKPVIAGTRISVALILNLIAHGKTIDEIIDDYPDLTREDIKAAVQYAERVVEKDKIAPEPQAVAHEISNRRRSKL